MSTGRPPPPAKLNRCSPASQIAPSPAFRDTIISAAERLQRPEKREAVAAELTGRASKCRKGPMQDAVMRKEAYRAEETRHEAMNPAPLSKDERSGQSGEQDGLATKWQKQLGRIQGRGLQNPCGTIEGEFRASQNIAPRLARAYEGEYPPEEDSREADHDLQNSNTQLDDTHLTFPTIPLPIEDVDQCTSDFEGLIADHADHLSSSPRNSDDFDQGSIEDYLEALEAGRHPTGRQRLDHDSSAPTQPDDQLSSCSRIDSDFGSDPFEPDGPGLDHQPCHR